MSVSICVVAQKKITERDRKYIEIYNLSVDENIFIAPEVLAYIKAYIDPDAEAEVPLELVETEYVEIEVYTEGVVESEEGGVVKLEDLPPGTERLRIYMM